MKAAKKKNRKAKKATKKAVRTFDEAYAALPHRPSLADLNQLDALTSNGQSLIDNGKFDELQAMLQALVDVLEDSDRMVAASTEDAASVERLTINAWHRTGAVSFEMAIACTQPDYKQREGEGIRRETYRHIQSCRTMYLRGLERMRSQPEVYTYSAWIRMEKLKMLGEATSMTPLFRWEAAAYFEEAIDILENELPEKLNSNELCGDSKHKRNVDYLRAALRRIDIIHGGKDSSEIRRYGSEEKYMEALLLESSSERGFTSFDADMNEGLLKTMLAKGGNPRPAPGTEMAIFGLESAGGGRLNGKTCVIANDTCQQRQTPERVAVIIVGENGGEPMSLKLSNLRGTGRLAVESFPPGSGESKGEVIVDADAMAAREVEMRKDKKCGRVLIDDEKEMAGFFVLDSSNAARRNILVPQMSRMFPYMALTMAEVVYMMTGQKSRDSNSRKSRVFMVKFRTPEPLAIEPVENGDLFHFVVMHRDRPRPGNDIKVDGAGGGERGGEGGEDGADGTSLPSLNDWSVLAQSTHSFDGPGMRDASRDLKDTMLGGPGAPSAAYSSAAHSENRRYFANASIEASPAGVAVCNQVQIQMDEELFASSLLIAGTAALPPLLALMHLLKISTSDPPSALTSAITRLMVRDATPRCGHCNAIDADHAFDQCGACKQLIFCGKECQRLNWPDHKKECKKVAKAAKKAAKKG